MIDLKNKNIFVTGATGGIGGSIIEMLNIAGANLIASGSNQKKLEMIKSKYKNVKIIKFDISNHNEIGKLVDEVCNLFDGKIDGLVNNAGINRDNIFLRMSLEEWQKVLDINLTSNFLISKFFIKKMIKNKSGKIVNITSIVGHTGNMGQANYAASKSGIIGMSKSLALEYAKKNILINCISPGFIDTAMTDKIDDKFKAQLIDKIPINRLGKPLDVANAVSFLMSDLSDYITGETIHVNGGMYFG
tara:strand:+ start:748 stop:1485 length:738 start_codon:yes stop_codon:yes gene_type:complete